MRTPLRKLIALFILVGSFALPTGGAAMSIASATRFPGIGVQMRPLRPNPPLRRPGQGKSLLNGPTTVRYSQSAWAANMVMPAIWLGLPTIVIIALIIRSTKGD